METLERNRVFSLEDIEGLKTDINNLMDQAIEISGQFNMLVDQVEAWAARIPDIPEGNILKTMSLLYVMDYVFSNYAETKRHANKLLNRIISNIPDKDGEAADLTETIKENVNRAGEMAGDLKILLEPGMLNLSYYDYCNTVERRFLQNETLEDEEKMKLAIESLGYVEECTVTGDPVNVATGNFFFRETDLCIRGIPFLQVERTYNSLNRRKGIFGRGWSSNFEIKLEVDEENRVKIIKEDGNTETFVCMDGEYRCLAKAFSTLSFRDGNYSYRSGGTKVLFSEKGRALRLENQWKTGINLTYSEEGILISVDSDDGRKLCFTYEKDLLTEIRDDMGRRVRYGYRKKLLCSVSDPMGHIITYEYGSSNRIERLFDKNGNLVVWNRYDKYRRVVSQSMADGGEIVYNYPSNKNYTEVKYQDGHVVRYHYNKKFETSLVTDGSNHSKYELSGCRYRDIRKSLYEMITACYDEKGNIVRLKRGNVWDEISYGQNGCPDRIRMGEGCEFRFEYDEYNRVVKRIDGRGYERKYEYDLCDRITCICYPDGSKTNYDYDSNGNVTHINKSTGKRVRLQYDAMNHMTAIIENEDRKMEIFYDKSGNPSRIVTPEGSVLNTEKKECTGRPEVKKSHDRRQKNKGQEIYDPAGNVVTQKFQDGREFTYEYDSMNRVIAMIENGESRYEFSYGQSGKCISRKSPSGNITKFRYDEYGNIESVTDATDNSFSLKQVRMIQRDPETIKDIDSIHNQPKFSMEEIECLSSTGVREKRDFCGRLTGRYYPGGIESAYEYSCGMRISRITHKKEGIILEDLAYEYDREGNCVLIKKYRKDCPQDSGTFTYEYDCLNRLVRVLRNGTLKTEYSYDRYGGRIKKFQGNRSYNYIYDSEGKLCYTDDRIPLKPEKNIEILCRKKSEAEKEYEVRRENLRYRVIYRNLPEAVAVNGQIKYLLTDHLGSVLRVFKEDGTQESIYSFDEFGCSMGDIPVYAGYAGYIPASEEVYATESRYYAPALGRFLTRDRWMGNMGNPQTWNPWIYAVNNPVRYKDASGYSPVEAWSDADWYSTIPGETKESSWAPDFIAYSIEEDAASGGKGFKANAAGAEYQETFLDWLDGASDNLMQTKAGDVMVYRDMMTVNFTIPGLMPSVYGWEMLVEGKTYEESTKEIQDFFRGYNKSMVKYIPETLYGMISIPESLWTVGESVSENGLLNTVKAMGSGIIDGITTTVRDDLVNGTAKSRGEIVGDCATFILEFVIGSKLLKDVITKNAVPDADDVSDALKGVADKTNDVLKGTENALKDNADDILQKTDDVLEHMDDVPEVKGKGMEDAAKDLPQK